MMATSPLPPMAVAMASARGLTLLVQVSADEEQAAIRVAVSELKVATGMPAATAFVDEGRNARVTGDGGDGVVLLSDGRFDAWPNTSAVC